MERGILYVATGQSYVDAAVQSALSVKTACGQGLRTHLYADREPKGDAFDSWELVENPHVRSKVDYMHKTPFEHTLYLDCDTQAQNNFVELFDLLDRYDVGLCHAQRRIKTHEMVWQEAVPYAFPQLNSGVFLYRRTEPVVDLLQQWSKAFHESGFNKDQITLRELLWNSSLRMAVLPPEYNIRYPKMLKHFAKDVVPKIIHDPNFVQGKTSLSRRVSNRLKNIAASSKA
ncbi:MAG: putative nucleotide-diphospho-sugar transferase [Pseudomonadota bacterium]